MVSPYKASFDPREIAPLSRNILHNCGVEDHGITGQRASLKLVEGTTDYRDWLAGITNLKVSASHLNYLADARDSAKSGLGHTGNRHLNYLVESITVNVGDPGQDAKASSLPMPDRGVGAAIVVGGWESQPHGEGPQSVGISRAK